VLEAGSWVELYRVVLPAGERAAQVPVDTATLPLEMRVRGHLLAAAGMGAQARVRTASGRVVQGRLLGLAEPYRHGFGPPVPELLAIGPDLRARLGWGRPESE
jgi:hypothetical protein